MRTRVAEKLKLSGWGLFVGELDVVAGFEGGRCGRVRFMD